MPDSIKNDEPDRSSPSVVAAWIAGVLGILGASIAVTIITLPTSKPIPAEYFWLLLFLGFLLFVGLPGYIVVFWYRRTSYSSLDYAALWKVRSKVAQFEIGLIAGLIVLAVAAFVASYFASRSVFTSVQEQRFGPSETAQVITAVGGLGLAIGSSIAAIIKAYALLIRARADFIRAKLKLPPGEDFGTRADRQLSGPK